MSANYVKLTAGELERLPVQKQAEVYDFAKFLNAKKPAAPAKRKTRRDSILKIVGLGKSGVRDLALNHDKYLYD